ncbi:MAG: FGGY family carbohydrate kinase [Phycisphaerae bacterium]|nr:FGGY family carbohydrate kinase [Phycisphaerae bacterium]
MAEKTHHLVAVDLGASNGRVVLGRLSGKQLRIEVVHRFEHRPRRADGRLRWDWDAICSGMFAGLRAAAEQAGRDGVAAISCSSWAQDFGLLDEADNLFYPPVSYRDERTRGMPDSFREIIAPGELVRRVGCGALPVTALCQLRAMSLAEPHVLQRARRLLFMADLAHFFLCGSRSSDWSMATASQLRNLGTGAWDTDLLDDLGIPHHFLPEVVTRQRVLGCVPAENPFHPSLAGVPVISTAGHDTAVGTACMAPLHRGDFFLNLGTWAMLGCCTGDLVMPEDPVGDNLTVLGLVHPNWAVFRAGAGLWLLQECRRLWRERGLDTSDEQLTAEAERASIDSRIDPAEARFHSPGNMLLEIARACHQAGGRVPESPGEYAKVIFDSLAYHYAGGLRRLERVLGLKARRLRVLCGGSRNGYLCGRIAEACGVEVLAGPAEATAIGNILLQAQVMGILGDDDDLTRVMEESFASTQEL